MQASVAATSSPRWGPRSEPRGRRRRRERCGLSFTSLFLASACACSTVEFDIDLRSCIPKESQESTCACSSRLADTIASRPCYGRRLREEGLETKLVAALQWPRRSSFATPNTSLDRAQRRRTACRSYLLYATTVNFENMSVANAAL